MMPLLFEPLLRRALDRMRLINGPETKCVYAGCRHGGDVSKCPNHQLMREIEWALGPNDFIPCEDKP